MAARFLEKNRNLEMTSLTLKSNLSELIGALRRERRTDCALQSGAELVAKLRKRGAELIEESQEEYVRERQRTSISGHREFISREINKHGQGWNEAADEVERWFATAGARSETASPDCVERPCEHDLTEQWNAAIEVAANIR